MREINLENDDHVFKMKIKNKGFLFVDGFELASSCAEIKSVVEGGDPTSADIADAIREVGWSEGCDISEFTNHEVFSAGIKVLEEIEKLGNE